MEGEIASNTELALEVVEWRQTNLDEWFELNITDMDKAEQVGRYLLTIGEKVQEALGRLFLHVEKGKPGRGVEGGLRELARRLEMPRRTAQNYVDGVLGKKRVLQLCENGPARSHFIQDSDLSKYREIERAPDPDAAARTFMKCTIENERTPTFREVLDIVEEQRLALPAPPIPPSAIYYADPPWEYDFSETDCRRIENQYPTMTLEQIKAIDIPADENAVLYLWATAPKLREALEVMQAWGFEYKTHAVWDKVLMGMGYWFRGIHELLLVGVRGDFSPPDESVRRPSVFHEPRTEHSRKPDCIYEMIEQQFPGRRKVELFARQRREGWDSWGNEIEEQVV